MANIKSIIKDLHNSQSVKAVGYRVPDQAYLSISGPKSYLTAFGMMVDVLSGIEAVVAVEGTADRVPNVDNKFKRGTQEHAHEICATLEQIEDDIFATHDNGITFIAIGSDAEDSAISNLLAAY